MKIAILVLLTGLAGGASPHPDWRGPLEAVGIRFVSAREVQTVLECCDALTVVDARDEVPYRRGHLPDAISVPAEDRPLRFIDVRRPKRLLHAERLPADRDAPVVFYRGRLN